MRRLATTFCLTLVLLFGNVHADEVAECLQQLTTKSWEQLTEAAERGDACSQDMLGWSYYLGSGISRDYVLALKYFTLAAEQGIASSQFYLAEMYDKGLGVPQNYDIAIKWYMSAAEQDPRDDGAGAILRLGDMYCKGEGVDQDYNSAKNWFMIGSEHGIPAAKLKLGLMYFEGGCATQNYAAAKEWFILSRYSSSSDSDGLDGLIPAAQYYLGLMYYEGFGVATDYKIAQLLFDKARQSIVTILPFSPIADEHPRYLSDIQYYTGLMFYYGQGVLEHYISAHVWLNLASSNGHNLASKTKDLLVKKMTADDIAAAQKLVQDCAVENSRGIRSIKRSSCPMLFPS